MKGENMHQGTDTRIQNLYGQGTGVRSSYSGYHPTTQPVILPSNRSNPGYDFCNLNPSQEQDSQTWGSLPTYSTGFYGNGAGNYQTTANGGCQQPGPIPTWFPQPAHTSNPTRGRAKSSSPGRQGHLSWVQCPLCLTVLNGSHSKGNLTRHRKNCGDKSKSYPCDYEGCHRSYARSDARLKHHRKSHGNSSPSNRHAPS